MDAVRAVSRLVAAPLTVTVAIISVPGRLLRPPLAMAVALTSMPHRLDAVVAGSELVVERANRLMLDIEETNRRAANLVTEVAVVTRAAAAVAERAGAVAVAAGVAADETGDVTRAAGIVTAQLQELVAVYEAVLREASPALDELARLVEPHHAQALVQALQVLPELLRPAVPATEALAELAPDLQQLADRIDGVGQVVEGIPGAKLLRRRAAKDGDDD